MQLSVNGNDVFVATGGKPFDPSLPAVVMIHGAGFDHSTWALHSRWFAHHGYSVLAPDLPGHGRSGGKPLPYGAVRQLVIVIAAAAVTYAIGALFGTSVA